MKTDELLAETVIKITIIFILILVCVLRAWVIMKLWNWYIAPVFGIPELTVAYSFGVSLLVFYMVYRRARSDENESPLALITSAVMAAGFALLFGWIGTFFI